MEAALAGFDAVLSPTVPMRRAADRQRARCDDDEAFFARQRACCCATRSVVNMLDGCALSHALPAPRRAAGRPDGLAAARCTTTPCSTPACAIEAALADRDPSPRRLSMRSRRHRRRHHRRHHGLRAGRRRPRGHRVRAPRRASPRKRSFANAGLVAPGYVTPWAAPGMPGKVAAPPVQPRTRRCASPAARRATLGWMWRWWRACQPAASTGQSRAHAAPRLLQPRRGCTSSPTHLQLEYERSAGLPGAAARRTRARAGRSRACTRCATLGVALRATSTPRSAARSSRASIPTRRCRRHPPAGRRGRQLPRSSRTCCARRPSARRALPLQRTVERFEPARRRACASCSAPHDARDEALRSRDADDWPTRSRRPASTEPSFDAVVVCAASTRRRCCARSACTCRSARCYGYSITAPLRHDDRTSTSSRARR